MIITSATSYSIVPNFEKLNEHFSKDNFYLPLFSTLALIVCTPSSSLLNRVALVSCIGIVAIKGLLMASAYVQGKIAPAPKHHRTRPIAEKIVTLPKKQERRKLQVTPVQSREPTIDDRKANYALYERLICTSFPDPDSKYYDPVPYTFEQLERECEQWMEDALAIGDPLLLQRAYQKIFNLSENTEISEDNREILISWKERFFTPGTKQYEWRAKYNQAMAN